LNASRQRRSSDDDEDTLGFVGEIEAVSIDSVTFIQCFYMKPYSLYSEAVSVLVTD